MKIAIQNGLTHLESALREKGYDVVPYRSSGMDSKIAIIHNIDAAYEEMEPVSYVGEGASEMLILNASMLSEAQVLKQVEKYHHSV